MKTIDELCTDTLRFLAVDQIEEAHSGHPGLPLGAAPMAYVLWDRFLRHNPENPKWFDRDRFILSAGHGSALLYALLHMTGYNLSLDELKRFRQLGSKTPGHPEHNLTPGVEATTGPLGQGFAMGVGMAIAEANLAARFNRPGYEVVNHYTYAIVSDGDLMEGVSSEAASLAGRLHLGKLVYLYDDNGITIEGDTSITFTEDVGGRFESYGWQVLKVDDGNDFSALVAAIGDAREEPEHPSLVIVKTHIGFGSPKQDSAAAHGSPLGPMAAKATKDAAGWPSGEAFHVPEEAGEHMRLAIRRGEGWENRWKMTVGTYRVDYPELAAAFLEATEGRLPEGWEEALPNFGVGDGPIATRNASGIVLNALAARIPSLVGGSADLTPSNKSSIKESPGFFPGSYEGRNLHFGIREFAMGAAVNGIALHGGLIPYCATFLVFSDYARPALRLAALMQCPSIFLFTHDSIHVGEDGPTHQPIEQLMSLRLIPGLCVWRPADANETAAAWGTALKLKRPAVLVLTRQKLPVLSPGAQQISGGTARGGYTIRDAGAKKPQVVIVATGSEVHLALEARSELSAKEISARVVSMPCRELFEEAPTSYKEEILPPGVPRLVIEAGRTLGWEGYAGDGGAILGIDRFGVSAPGNIVAEHLGLTVDRAVEIAVRLVSDHPVIPPVHSTVPEP